MDRWAGFPQARRGAERAGQGPGDLLAAQRGPRIIPMISRASATMGEAMASAFSAPARRMRSISAGSPISSFIRRVIGSSTDTARSASAGLKVPKPWPSKRASSASGVSPDSAA